MAKSTHAQRPRKMTADRVVKLAKSYLEPQQPADYRLEVVPDGVREDGDWWYVLVRPSRDDIHSYDYYGRLAEAEINLRDGEGVNVLLVPVLPE